MRCENAFKSTILIKAREYIKMSFTSEPTFHSPQCNEGHGRVGCGIALFLCHAQDGISSDYSMFRRESYNIDKVSRTMECRLAKPVLRQPERRPSQLLFITNVNFCSFVMDRIFIFNTRNQLK